MENDNKLKLIYVLKIGKNSKNECLYEFIFSKDETNIDPESWGWETSPAIDNAQAPAEDYVDLIVSLKTEKFNLFCLHEAVDREYMHGFHTIHALAYETENNGSQQTDGYDDYETLFEGEDDEPLLVFHYGMTLKRISDMLYGRKIILKGHEFIDTSRVKIDG